MAPPYFEPGIRFLQDSYAPISEQDVRDFERVIGNTLPEDYRAFLLQRNGGDFSHDETCPIKDERGYQGDDKIGLEWINALRHDPFGLQHKRETYIGELPTEMLIVGAAPMGDDLVVSLVGKQRGAVYLFDHEGPGEWDERLYLIADSFGEFMRAIRTNPEITEKLPIFQAAQTADFEALDSLLKAGASLEARNELGETPLVCAAGWRQPPSVKHLLAKGAALEARDNTGKTALIHAARSGSIDCVRLLLDAGADINAQDNDGESPLTASIRDMGGGRVANYLVDRGANIRLQTKRGETAMSLATYRDLRELLARRLEE